MDKISMTLTVYFEEGFWHGLFEQEHAQSYRVCRVTFGAEPSTQELLDFLNRYYHRLQFSPSIRVNEKTKSVSPKRLQRQAKKEQMASRSSKSQEALSLQLEEQKKIARVKRKEQKELAKQRKFELKQQKRLEKHKGIELGFSYFYGKVFRWEAFLFVRKLVSWLKSELISPSRFI